MNEQDRTRQVEDLLAQALEQTADIPALLALHQALEQSREQLRQPMRVAVVGQIKAGKSTCMNALLGAIVVETGTTETTFNVNWLQYGERKELKVHFKDDRPVETTFFEELGHLTRRDDERLAYLSAIKYIEVFFPNEMLHLFHLIDTPGLRSVYEVDSQNTLDHILGANISDITRREAANADAVLYLFSRNLSSAGLEIMQEFRGHMLQAATPINTLGVLTKVDTYWPEVDEPFGAARRVIHNLQRNHADIERTFYTILPVCGQYASGTQTLTEAEFADLRLLSKVSKKTLGKKLEDAHSFAHASHQDLPLASEQRQALLRKLGQYGIWCISGYLSEHEDASLPEIQNWAYADSGLLTLRTLLLNHFGNRASLIKLDKILHTISTTIFQLRGTGGKQAETTLQQISYLFEQFSTQQEGLSELQVLRAHYEGRLAFNTEQIQQLLQVTGEYGRNYQQLLGLQENAEKDIVSALAVAQSLMRQWRFCMLDPTLDYETSHAAGVIARSYERIVLSLEELLIS